MATGDLIAALILCLIFWVGIWVIVDAILKGEVFCGMNPVRMASRIKSRPVRVVTRLVSVITWPVWSLLVIVGAIAALAFWLLALLAYGAARAARFLIS